eukprot:COSAG02_NODE_1855_length_10650_cov_4.154677_3_plen_113_part_00
MIKEESVMVKDILDCQLVDQKGKTWGLCFHMTTKDPSGHPRCGNFSSTFLLFSNGATCTRVHSTRSESLFCNWLPYRARYYATSSKDESVYWINLVRALAGLKVVLEGVSTD